MMGSYSVGAEMNYIVCMGGGVCESQEKLMLDHSKIQHVRFFYHEWCTYNK